MGVLNVTPDSFSDGANFQCPEQAMVRARQMVSEGVDIIDIGGESTRPGADEVSLSEELKRVVPVIEAVKPLGKFVSVDTSKPEVMEAALEAGADMINDVSALSADGALEVIARYQVPVCLMHMQGEPRSMQHDPAYQDVVSEVYDYLKDRLEVCEKAGIGRDLITIDPGFGFGKSLQHNVALLKYLAVFNQLNVPVLAGLSRKSMLGQITGRPVDERMPASIAVALMAMQKGASIIRVHDVAQTVDVKKVYLATR